MNLNDFSWRLAMDLIYIAVLILFFGLMAALAVGVAKLGGPI